MRLETRRWTCCMKLLGARVVKLRKTSRYPRHSSGSVLQEILEDRCSRKCSTYQSLIDSHLASGSITSQCNSQNFVELCAAINASIDILRGLEFLHDAGFYHNDIKPQNILIGNEGQALLTDYGISEISNSGGAVKPKLQYLPHKAPETYDQGVIDGRSDIYQVGLTLFRLTNGVNLIGDVFQSCTPDKYADLVKGGKLLDEAGWQPFAPSSLKRIVNKAINPVDAERYATALEMRRALEKLNFPGSWNCASNGEYIGECGRNTFTYEIVPRTTKRSDFLAKRENKVSQRETRVSKFCAKDLTQTKLLAARKKFMTAVVEGKV